MKVFFDASVIIAAILSSSGGSSLLLEFIRVNKIAGITSLTVVDEILEEDKSKKLNKTKVELEQFIAESGLLVRKRVTTSEISAYEGMIDIEDAHLIAAANRTKCKYLVTLDKKHLLNQNVKKLFLPLKIVSPKELLEIILSP